jgi:acetyltransferase-like isoleucine patch superfamily enzyme
MSDSMKRVEFPSMKQKCVPARLWLTQLLIRLLPPTRLYRFKRELLFWSGVDIHPTARLCSTVRIVCSGRLSIGADTFIGHEVLIGGGDAPITIGNACNIGPRTIIVSGGHEIALEGPRIAGAGFSKAITIEDGTWVSAGCMVLAGVTIGRRSLIGPGSVVVHDVPEGWVGYCGPARPPRAPREEQAG